MKTAPAKTYETTIQATADLARALTALEFKVRLLIEEANENPDDENLRQHVANFAALIRNAKRGF